MRKSFTLVLVTILAWVIHAKQKLIDGITALDTKVTLENYFRENQIDVPEEFLPNSTEIIQSTFDGNLLENYFKVFSGNLSEVQSAISSLMENSKGKNPNGRALRYFLKVQSQLINEITNPFIGEQKSLEELNFDFQYNEDPEIMHHIKLNYLNQMQFWKEYVCLFHEQEGHLSKIHEDYLRILSLLGIKDSNLKAFRWLDFNCQCTLDKAAIFLNPAYRATQTSSDLFGHIPTKGLVTDETPVDLEVEKYFSKEIKVVEEMMERQEGDEGVDVGGQVVYGEGRQVGGEQVQEGQEVVEEQHMGEQPVGEQPAAEQPVGEQPANGQPGEQNEPMDNAQMGNNDAMNNQNGVPPVGGNQGGGLFGFLNRMNPFSALSMSRMFGNKYHNPELIQDHEDHEPSRMKLLKDNAIKANSSDHFLNIANLYMVGHTEMGLTQDTEKALKYYKIAAEMGNGIAMYNIAVFNQNDNQTLAFEYFQRCAELNMSMCYRGLGNLYLNQKFPEHNTTKAIEYFEKALEEGFHTTALDLAIIYLRHGENKNHSKALDYLELAIEKTDSKEARLMLISELLEDQTLLSKFVSCKRIYKLIKYNLMTSEIDFWYNLGYTKYTMGKFDQALMLFSFASLNGHKKATLAAAYIWEHDLTQDLTCKLGHHSLCAFIYNMQSFFFNDDFAGIRAARTLLHLQDLELPSSADLKKQAAKAALKIFSHLESKIPEAKFNKALSLSTLYPESPSKAYHLLDQMLAQALNGTIGTENIFPALAMSGYLKGEEYFTQQ